MLILSRKVGETIIIDGNITVTVKSIDRGKVRIGFDAPAGVPIHREEIHRRIANEAAKKTDEPAS
jgi:carbon storage regulator